MKQNVVEWFDRTAAEMPEAPALSCSGQDVTFGRLQQQANVWANRLLAGGLQTAEAVGIFTPNRTLAITAILAVLKTGGAFVPLDTTLPVRRLQALLEHVPLRWLLTDRPQADVTTSLGDAISGARCLSLDGEGSGDAWTVWRQTRGRKGRESGRISFTIRQGVQHPACADAEQVRDDAGHLDVSREGFRSRRRDQVVANSGPLTPNQLSHT
jgi:non-ribosomal peptide synthetase component F